jgi:carnosine N-methyltransferase
VHYSTACRCSGQIEPRLTTAEEQRHFSHVISAFKQYAQYSVCLFVFFKEFYMDRLEFWQLSANNRRRKDLYALSKADQEVLEGLGYKQKLDEVDKAIIQNAEFLGQIVANPEIFGHDLGIEEEEHHHNHGEDLQSQDHSHEQESPGSIHCHFPSC